MAPWPPPLDPPLSATETLPTYANVMSSTVDAGWRSTSFVRVCFFPSFLSSAAYACACAGMQPPEPAFADRVCFARPKYTVYERHLLRR